MVNPKTIDGVNYTLHGCAVTILTPDDIIYDTDFIRDLVNREYWARGENYDNMAWHIACDDMPAWVGRTYKEYMEFAEMDEIQHEIVRVII